MQSSRSIATGVALAATLAVTASPAVAEAPRTTTDQTVKPVTIPAFRANAACAELGYEPRLLLTFERTVRSIEFDDGRLIEVARISGTISGGGETTARFRAVRVFQVRPDRSEHDAGLSYQYRIPGTTTVIGTEGRDDLTDAENFRPLCEALLT